MRAGRNFPRITTSPLKENFQHAVIFFLNLSPIGHLAHFTMLSTGNELLASGDQPRGERMNRDDYVIRIYRRGPKDRRMVVGTVEKVSGKLKMSFTDFEELRLIMGVPRGRIPRKEIDSGFPWRKDS